MKARIATVVVMSVLAIVGFSTPASAALPPLKIKSASAILCLTNDADAALAAAGITFGAIAPATSSTNVDGRACVTIPAEGTLSLDQQHGNLTFGGGITFTQAEASVRFTDIRLDMQTCADTCVLTAQVNDQTTRIDWVTVGLFTEGSVWPDPLTASIEDLAPVRITQQGVDALQDAFGTRPVAADSVMFDAVGKAELVPAAIGAVTGLIQP